MPADPFPADPLLAGPVPGALVSADPFGSSDGWSERHKYGDLWAIEVMKALNGMDGDFSGAEGEVAEFMFDLELCPDGRLASGEKKGTGDDARRADPEIGR
ncbi:hypothetical protein OV090_06780 [Nannocystis sp. RBIL2]|uniref:hypothetical protein n=1 Tax=Nannocystis sp. RBIL2 TaxID=2996788 RepID=UPI002271B0C7|nr:hypothetical protein [Nannocystis sp. RBIL2]MCY1064457.1 hypothetical protein [Nannocystis sp. RBIL2]